MSADVSIEEYVPLPTAEPFADVHLNFTEEKSLIPRTLGSQRKPHDEVLCFCNHPIGWLIGHFRELLPL